MSFFNAMDTAASGLTAQRFRLDIISQNMANANTTRTENGGAYKRQSVVFEQMDNNNSFSNILRESKKTGTNGVRVARIITDDTRGALVYDPGHPDSNEEGYVEMPNVNVVDEMVNMISASRAYEANVTSFNTMKSMFTKTLEIGK